jgi:DNA polymerase-3 subunit gamma/tau
VQEHLQTVLTQEGISADAGALKLLARGAHGSMRDALSLTDQAIAFGAGSLSEAGVREMLGAVDSSFVFDTIAALAAGDGQRVVAIAKQLRAAGVSAAFALEDMARVLQKMAVYQALGGAAEATSDDAEEQRILQLAQTMPADETQLLYSMAIHGRAELGLAPDEYAGLVMTLLRLLAFKPAGFVPVQGSAASVQQAETEKKNLNNASIVTIKTEAAQAGFTPEKPENTPKNEPNVELNSAVVPPAVDSRLRGNDEGGLRGNEEKDLKPSEALTPVAVDSRFRGNDEGGLRGKDEGDLREDDGTALQLPVREMASSSSRLEQSNPAEADAAAHADWLTLVQQLVDAGAIQAMQRELAIQSQCSARGDDWRTLRVEQNALRSDSVREKLQNALAAVGQPCLLRVELGPVQGSWAQRQLAAQNAQLATAQANFSALPLVQHLLQDWGGKILPGSVQVAP